MLTHTHRQACLGHHLPQQLRCGLSRHHETDTHSAPRQAQATREQTRGARHRLRDAPSDMGLLDSVSLLSLVIQFLCALVMTLATKDPERTHPRVGPPTRRHLKILTLPHKSLALNRRRTTWCHLTLGKIRRAQRSFLRRPSRTHRHRRRRHATSDRTPLPQSTQHAAAPVPRHRTRNKT